MKWKYAQNCVSYFYLNQWHMMLRTQVQIPQAVLYYIRGSRNISNVVMVSTLRSLASHVRMVSTLQRFNITQILETSQQHAKLWTYKVPTRQQSSAEDFTTNNIHESLGQHRWTTKMTDHKLLICIYYYSFQTDKLKISLTSGLG